jgi:holo-[acyl-carrier protein] synthase
MIRETGETMTDRQDVGVGVDLVSVTRIEVMLKRWGRKFLNRVYTDREIDYCVGRYHPARSLAARFAAKEAFFKAVSRSGTAGIRYRDIETVVRDDGVPELKPHGRAKTALGRRSATLSMSHEQDLAAAVVVTSPEVKG